MRSVSDFKSNEYCPQNKLENSFLTQDLNGKTAWVSEQETLDHF